MTGKLGWRPLAFQDVSSMSPFGREADARAGLALFVRRPLLMPGPIPAARSIRQFSLGINILQ